MPFVRERDSVNAPLEESAAGNLLELPHRDGDGALRDVQFTRCPGDLSRAGRCHEVADLSQRWFQLFYSFRCLNICIGHA